MSECLHLRLMKLADTAFATLIKDGSKLYRCTECKQLLKVKLEKAVIKVTG